MTFRYPLQRKPRAAQGAVLLDRLRGISRARRIEAAARTEQRREQHAISGYQPDEDAFHGEICHFPTMFRIRDLRHAYDGVDVLQIRDWLAEQGEHWLVLGPSGS